MKQEARDAAVAARAKAAAWPSAEQASEYLVAKGFVAAGPGVWTLPSPDHKPTAKQTACLRVLKAKTATPPKAHAITAKGGKFGAGR